MEFELISERFIACVLISLILLSCQSSGGERIDNIPMYGQPEIKRPAALKKADEDFVEQASSGFGSREEASKAWFAEGDKFMDEGNFDYAMRRYNQSWLLNPDSYKPYWGFGRIALQKGQIDDAIKYLEKAELLIDDPYEKVALLSDMGSAYTEKGILSPSYFSKANEKFSESVTLDPNYPKSWRRWAFSLYEQGDYRGAWDKVEKAESLNARPFPPRFISALEKESPRAQ